MTGKRTAIYTHGAADFRASGPHPNHALIWAAIQWGCEHGFRTFDLGRTRLDDAALRAFKSGWGARETRLVYATIADELPRDGLQAA